MDVYNIGYSITIHLAKYFYMLGYQLVLLVVQMLYVHKYDTFLVFLGYLQLWRDHKEPQQLMCLVGAHNANIAGPMTAICSSSEAGPKEGRYVASVVNGH